MKYTIAEALHEMQRLRGADAGRLRGIELHHDLDLDRLTRLDTLPPPWGTRLVDLIEARKRGSITADTPHYLVYSDLCRPRHKSDYAEPPVMPRPSGCRSLNGLSELEARHNRAPFVSEAIEEGEQGIRCRVAAGLAVRWRGSSESTFLERHIGVQVDLSRCRRFVPEPERDD